MRRKKVGRMREGDDEGVEDEGGGIKRMGRRRKEEDGEEMEENEEINTSYCMYYLQFHIGIFSKYR